MKTVKVVFYWLSIVLPLIDVIAGIKDGVKRAAQDTADDIAKAARVKVEAAQRELWERANAANGEADEKGGGARNE